MWKCNQLLAQKFTYVVEMAKVLYVSNPISNVQLHIFLVLAILELSVHMTENSLRSCQRITAKAINDVQTSCGVNPALKHEKASDTFK